MQGFIRVAGLENTFEAQILGAILTERQIPHSIRSYYDTAYDGLFQGQKGWGAVFAPAEYAAEIAAAVAEIRAQPDGNV
jgi:hypothetical protein